MAVLLNEQKYKNNIRTVSGLVSVTDDDVILSVDTSAGSCSIDLGIIPQKNWSTLYKLYIYDQSDNASANNITLNAAVGQTINGSSSFTINVNGGGVFVRILGLNRYGASATFTTGGGGNGHVIEDEGIALPQQPNLNFVGGGVQAFDDPINNKTVVRVIGGMVILTNSELLTLINTNTVIAGQFYQVTDAIFITNYFALEETVPVIVEGITNNSVSLHGSGIFLNADYQQVGNYIAIKGFLGNIGVWNNGISGAVGEVVMWNNQHYLCINDSISLLTPDQNPSKWQLLPKSLDYGFIQEIDFITYDVFNNVILSRKDCRNNYVENNFAETQFRGQAFYTFQWGNNKVAFNQVIQNSCFVCYQNRVIGGSIVNIDDLGIYQNVLQNRSHISLDNYGNTGVIKNNNLSGDNCAINFIPPFFETSPVGGNVGEIANNFLVDSFLAIRLENAQNQFSNNYFFNSEITAYIDDQNGEYISNNIISSFVRITEFRGFFAKNTINASKVDIITLQVNSEFTENNFFQGSVEGILGNPVFLLGGIFSKNKIDNGFIIANEFNISSNFSLNEISQQSTIQITVNNGTVISNKLKEESFLNIDVNNNQFGSELNDKKYGNVICGGSQISIGTHNSEFSDSICDRITRLTIVNNNNNRFYNVNFKRVVILCNENNGIFENLYCESGAIQVPIITKQYTNGNYSLNQINTIKVVIDLNDPTVYDPITNTLTIPDDVFDFAGDIRLDNSAGQIIDKIIGINDKFLRRIFCYGNSVQFNVVSIVPIVTNTIVSTNVGSLTIIGRVPPNLPDFIIVGGEDVRASIIQSVIYA